MKSKDVEWCEYCYNLLIENPLYDEKLSAKFLLMIENKSSLHNYSSGYELEQDYIKWLDNRLEE